VLKLNRREWLAAAVAPAMAAVKPVKITGLEFYDADIPTPKDQLEVGVQGRYTVVEVQTDAGVTGYSFAGYPAAQAPALRRIIVGQDLYAVEDHVRNGLLKFAGVEHAIWDAIGRIARQPVYKLLGGASNRVRAYLTCVWKGKLDQSHVPYGDQADMAVRIQKAGFKGMKIRAWRPNALDDVDACNEIRAATGPDFDIMFDRTAHAPEAVGQKIWDYETGWKVARGLEKHRALWLEEPFARDDYRTPGRLAAAVDILITGGEGFLGIEGFHQSLQHRTYDVLQPEGERSGGILLCRKVAMLAEARNVPVILHGTMALRLAGWLTASFAIGSEWQEVALLTPPLLPQQQWAPGLKLLRSKEMYRIEDGHFVASDLPGLGLDVNPDALREYRVPS